MGRIGHRTKKSEAVACEVIVLQVRFSRLGMGPTRRGRVEPERKETDGSLNVCGNSIVDRYRLLRSLQQMVQYIGMLASSRWGVKT